MSINSSDLLFRDESYQIVNCAIDVLNTFGHGFLEKPYENALCIELKERGIPFQQQQKHNIIYKGYVVGEYIPDLIVFNNIIVETKNIVAITNAEKGQVLNYLKITGFRLGIILNVKYAKLQYERVVL